MDQGFKLGDAPPTYNSIPNPPPQQPQPDTGYYPPQAIYEPQNTHGNYPDYNNNNDNNNVPSPTTTSDVLPLYGTADGYVVTQAAQAVPFTTLSTICTQPADPRYPEATALYQAMGSKFGPQNIVPPPDFLTTDAARVEWLKRDQNALLYFLHTKDGHLKEMQKILDGGMCCVLCSYPEADPHDEYSPCALCCIETFTCCCCASVSLHNLYNRYFPSRLYLSKPSPCCACSPSGVKLRQVQVKRWKKSGLTIHENACWSCCLLTWCQPCAATQSVNMAQYYFQARYGMIRMKRYQNELQYLNELVPSGAYSKYYSDIRQAASHPYSQAQKVVLMRQGGAGNLQAQSFVTTRETTIDHTVPRVELFHELYKPHFAIAEHNAFWEGIHAISME